MGCDSLRRVGGGRAGREEGAQGAQARETLARSRPAPSRPPPAAPAHPSPPPQWLTFWIVSALFTSVESALLLTKWVPLYHELKLLALVWLVAPQTKGATLVYERAIAPALKKHASKLDPVFAGADRALKSKQVAQVAALVEKYGPAAAQKVIDEASHRAADLVKPQ